MKPYAFQQTLLGTLITLEVAVHFAWLSALAIAMRSFVPQPPARH